MQVSHYSDMYFEVDVAVISVPLLQHSSRFVLIMTPLLACLLVSFHFPPWFGLVQFAMLVFRLDTARTICTAPEIYASAVLEARREVLFRSRYISWGKQVAEDVKKAVGVGLPLL